MKTCIEILKYIAKPLAEVRDVKAHEGIHGKVYLQLPSVLNELVVRVVEWTIPVVRAPTVGLVMPHAALSRQVVQHPVVELGPAHHVANARRHLPRWLQIQ